MISAAAVERDLAALVPYAVAEAIDLVVFAETTHPLLGPAIAMSGLLVGMIEQPAVSEEPAL